MFKNVMMMTKSLPRKSAPRRRRRRRRRTNLGCRMAGWALCPWNLSGLLIQERDAGHEGRPIRPAQGRREATELAGSPRIAVVAGHSWDTGDVDGAPTNVKSKPATLWDPTSLEDI